MINFPNNPAIGDAFNQGGTIYTCVLISPVVWNAAPAAAGIPDAPLDGLTYGRNTAAWKALDKADVGLDKVDNTSDATKPVSGPQQAALNGKEAVIAMGGVAQYWRGDKTWQVVDPAQSSLYLRDGGSPTGALIGFTWFDDSTAPQYIWGSQGVALGKVYSVNNVKVGHVSSINGASGGQITGRLTVTAPGDVAAVYAPDGGIYSDWNSASAIRSNVGGMYAATTIGAGGAITAGGAMTCNTLFAQSDQSVGLISNGNYPYVRFSSDNWRWQCDRTSGAVQWIHPNGTALFTVSGGGACTGATAYYSNSASSVVCNGTADDGAGSTYQDLIQGNPGWQWDALRAWHLRGSWAGMKFQSTVNAVEFILSNGGGYGSINAAAFNVSSDERSKLEIQTLPLQHDSFMSVVPISWKRNFDDVPPLVLNDPITGEPVEPITGPIYDDPDKIHWGFSAQNLSIALSASVEGDVKAVDSSGNPLTAFINPIPIIAVTVLEVQALWNKVAELEAEILTLKGTA